VKKYIKDVELMELVLSRIPTKALYNLQIRMVHRFHSRARSDATNLETTQEEKEVLETVIKETQIEHEEEKCHADRLEQRLEEILRTIPYSALAREINAEEKLKKITPTME
jgi:hypothetical protein